MTKSIVKAIDGSIAITINGEIHYATAEEVLINGQSLSDMQKQIVKNALELRTQEKMIEELTEKFEAHKLADKQEKENLWKVIKKYIEMEITK